MEKVTINTKHPKWFDPWAKLILEMSNSIKEINDKLDKFIDWTTTSIKRIDDKLDSIIVKNNLKI